ncbi:hypothetical protein AR687_03915 [Flavobacteriaceae bacterium CRH]|nr:hypothetical protein AR687_03915 [Flavobacteriaceae bacterium CRH]
MEIAKLCELRVFTTSPENKDFANFAVKKTIQHKIKNSGNQPEFQSSIKKRTVNQTVVYGKIPKLKNSKFQ